MQRSKRIGMVMQLFRWLRKLPELGLVLFILLLVSLSACSSSEEIISTANTPDQLNEQSQSEPAGDEDAISAGSPVPEIAGTQEQVAENNVREPDTSDPEVIKSQWAGGPHSDTFVLDEAGNNNSCARCHAPVVWLPSMEDMPESCFACKFEVSEPPPLIPEEAWVPIECMVCHEIDKQGNVEEGFAWLEIAQIEEYAEVESAAELCQKCHTAIDLPGHQMPSLGGAHLNYLCTDCHDAHDAVASCTSAGCHDGVLDPGVGIAGHDEEHNQVSCVACHDAGNMTVDFNEDNERWMTFSLDHAGGESVPLTSHETVLAAPCDRCHYVDNPWNLIVDVPSPP